MTKFKNTTKKWVLSLGTLASVAAPIATVVACGGSGSSSNEELNADKQTQNTSQPVAPVVVTPVTAPVTTPVIAPVPDDVKLATTKVYAINPTLTPVNVDVKGGMGSIEVSDYYHVDRANYEYQLDGASSWTTVDANGTISGLALGTYHFRWALTDTNNFVWDGAAPVMQDVEIVEDITKTLVTVTDPTITTIDADANGIDGGLEVLGLTVPTGARFEFTEHGVDGWTPIAADGTISGLNEGSYDFRWVLEDPTLFEFTSTPPVHAIESIGHITVPKTLITAGNMSLNPKASSTVAGNGEMSVYGISNRDNLVVEYQMRGDSTWKVLADGSTRVRHLMPGWYDFRWVLEDPTLFEWDGPAPSVVSAEIIDTAPKGTIFVVNPVMDINVPTTQGGTGSIDISNFQSSSDASMSYQLRGDSSWTPITGNGTLDNLVPGTYDFKWTLNDSNDIWLVTPTVFALTVNDYYAPNLGTGTTWQAQMNTNQPPVQYMWNADFTSTIEETTEVMGAQMGYMFPKPLGSLTPYEFGMWLLDMYNNNGSGHVSLSVTFQGQVDTVSIDFSDAVGNLVKSFDAGDITPTTALGTGGVLNIGVIMDLLDAVGQDAYTYSGSLFGKQVDGFVQAIGLVGNDRAGGFVNLLKPFPDETIQEFGGIIDIFKNMSIGFRQSDVASAWADAHGLQAEFSQIDQIMLAEVMKGAD